jgi:hypothetical protein
MSPEAAAGCHLLFVARGVLGEWEPALAEIRGRPILTVAGGGGFADRAGMFEFRWSGTNLLMRVNHENVKRGGLDLPAQFLRLSFVQVVR